MRLLARYITLAIFIISCLYLFWILISSYRGTTNIDLPRYQGDIPLRPLPPFQPPVVMPESQERIERLEKLEKLRERFDGPVKPLQVVRKPAAPLERDQHRVHARSRHGMNYILFLLLELRFI